MKTKSHPLIRELQLGKSCQELATELLESDDFGGFQRIDDEELVRIIKELVALNDPNVRFGVFTESDSCSIDLVNNGKSVAVEGYYDDEYRFHLEDDAQCDCEILNDLVERLFGPVKIKRKKVTKTEILKAGGMICPHCGLRETAPRKDEIVESSHLVLDDFTIDSMTKTLGCRECGGTWDLVYERKLKNVY